MSCDSATLARDLKVLCNGGYEVKKGRVVDMFPMTIHTEMVCQLVRKVMNGEVQEDDAKRKWFETGARFDL